MSIFRFKQFDLLQEEGVMKFGTDSMLLGSMAELENSKYILDIGTGTGILSLMCAQRSKAEILAIDKDPKACSLAAKNFAASPWGDRLTIKHADFIGFYSEKAFDLIISNPPFFKNNGQYLAQERMDMRSTQGLSFSELARGVEDNLTDDGAFWVILPLSESLDLEREAQKHDLYLQKEVLIRSYPGDNVIRRVLCFKKHPASLISRDFSIYKEFKKYSDKYLELTKDFHTGEGTSFN